MAVTEETSNADVLGFYKSQLGEGNSAAEIQEALQKLPIIARALGGDAVCQDLIPYLEEWVNDAPDDLAFTVAGQLPLLADYIGSRQQNLGHLISLCRRLALEEETVVREQALASLQALLDVAEKEGIAATLADTLLMNGAKEMVANCTGFAPRVSGVCWLPLIVAYTRNSEIKTTALQMLEQLLADDMPMVRRTAAAQLENIVPNLSSEETASFLIPLVKQLRETTTQEALHISAVKAAVAATAKLPRALNERFIQPLLESVFHQGHWSLRLCIVQSVPSVIRNYRACVCSVQPVVKILAEATADSEQFVRIAALKSLAEVIPTLKSSEIGGCNFESKMAALAQDPTPAVQVEAAAVMVPLSCVCGADIAKKSFVPIILDLMRSDNHDVRINVVRHTPLLVETLGVAEVGSVVVDAIRGLLADLQWRVRLESLRQLPSLAKQFGCVAFQQQFGPLYLATFSDPVDAVRLGAIDNIPLLATVLGKDWIAAVLVPFLFKKWQGQDGQAPLRPPPCRGSLATLRENKEGSSDAKETATTGSSNSFLSRITVVKAIPNVAGLLPPSKAESLLLPLLTNAFKDSVSNVRLAVCLISPLICEKAPVLKSSLKSFVVEAAENDTNADVRYFGEQAARSHVM